ncbi:MAG: isoprenyl transferase [Candidatus Marinimicrobia bacterium]|nr:isoprenyl transferase [Candidatus Neomarinimicrobiota bacterium]OUW50081.1 MAG: hypothetical protein CBD50_03880 [bacterium TMED190]
MNSKKNKILSSKKIPKHIAIIMDGNGRWAANKNLPRIAGHKEGINSVKEITQECGELGVKFLTLFTFSIENWRRPKIEVSALMNLLVETIKHEINELMKNNVRLHVIGRIMELPEKPRVEMMKGIEKTKNNSGLNLVLALNYSGRTEILDAVKKMKSDIDKKIINSEITEKTFSDYLYTKKIPDPDLVIRTSGESRISNFLLWQMAYSEIIITETQWPAFRTNELYNSILNYQSRERRFGKVSKQIK